MLKRTAIGLCAFLSLAHLLPAQTDERWRIPDSALAIVAHEQASASRGTRLAPVMAAFLASAGDTERVTMRRFGMLAAGSPAHLAPCRFHEPGKSIGEELRALREEDLQRAITAARSAAQRGEPLPFLALPDRNVVANYLLHHCVALHLAHLSRESAVPVNEIAALALEAEARGEGFLVDAFSPGHMRVPMWGLLRWLHTVNTEEAHDFYSSQGLFVANGRGEVWQAFGDQVTQWHAPSWDHVLEACTMSLRSVADPDTQWLVVASGETFYERLRLPVLMALPVPVSATRSYRSDATDAFGYRIRKHVPLMPDDALPPWMRGTVEAQNDSFVTSVSFVQELNYPPSYSGVVTALGGGWLPGAIYPAGIATGSVGYSPRWRFLPDLLVKLRVAGSVSGTMFFDRSGRGMVSGSVGFTLPFSFFGLSPDSPLALLHGFRLEAGHSEGVGSLAGSRGGVVTLGVESATIPLGFTYLGVVVRPRLDVHYMKERITTLMVEMVLL